MAIKQKFKKNWMKLGMGLMTWAGGIFLAMGGTGNVVAGVLLSLVGLAMLLMSN
jgi:hypothetical protein